LLKELPPVARWYIVSVIVIGALTFGLLIPRATFAPLAPLILLVVLSSVTSAYKVHFPIASGSNMSVSYVVDIASLILRGPYATMVVGAVSGWTQTTLKSTRRNPAYRVLFNMACLVITVQTAGQVYEHLGGRSRVDESSLIPLAGMALTYFLCNTIMIAFAIALTTRQSPWRVWSTDFASSGPNYLLGAAAAGVVIKVTEHSGYWLPLLLTAAPLYLTYKVYRAGVESEARQGTILEAAHDAIVTIDSRLDIREFNPAAEQLFGHRRSDILGRSVEMILPTSERTAQLAAISLYMTTGEGPLARRRIEFTGLRADGTEFPLELTVARVKSDNRSMTAFIRDMTERRLLEEQLRQSQKLEAIGRLAAGVAHDFNNILASIMGSAELQLLQMPSDDPMREEANEIRRAVERGAGLTRQLLAFSRRQPGRPRLLALDEIVCGMESMLRRLIGPEIECDIVRSREPVAVVADPGQIEQVVLNLVINARDAMPRGGRVTITVEDVEIDQGAAAALVEGRAGHYAQLRVVDTGSGIDEQTRMRLFEPFFTTKEDGKGTGLGLSIVYGIVKQCAGYVSVASEPGKGAAFTIFLPLAPTSQVAAVN
jgi:PAS domain S-box-containing protein